MLEIAVSLLREEFPNREINTSDPLYISVPMVWGDNNTYLRGWVFYNPERWGLEKFLFDLVRQVKQHYIAPDVWEQLP